MSYSLVTNNPDFSPSDAKKVYLLLREDITNKRFDDPSFHRTFFVSEDFAIKFSGDLASNRIMRRIFKQPFALFVPEEGRNYRAYDDYETVIEETNVDYRSPDFRPKRFVVTSKTLEKLIPVLNQKGVPYYVEDWRWGWKYKVEVFVEYFAIVAFFAFWFWVFS